MCTPCFPYLQTSIAHLYWPSLMFLSCWSPSLVSTSLLAFCSPGSPADDSTPLGTDDLSNFTLLQLSSPPHWQSSPTDVSLLSCRPDQQQQQPPSCDAHNCFCMHTWACPSAPLLTRHTDPLTSVSLRSLGSQLPALWLLQGQAQQQTVELSGEQTVECWSPGKAGGSDDGTLVMDNAVLIDL